MRAVHEGVIGRPMTLCAFVLLLLLLGANAALLSAAAAGISLRGCPVNGFTMPLQVGASVFDVLVDTGSGALALASSSCHTCTGVSPTWQNRSAMGSPTAGAYSDGSSWIGQRVNDTVQLQGSIVPLLPLDFSAITAQSISGYNADGSASSSAVTFFNTDRCNDGHAGQVTHEGIAGLSLPSASAPDTLLAQLWTANPALPRRFAVQLCISGGQLWVSEDPTSALTGEWGYTVLAQTVYSNATGGYAVLPTSISVSGVAVQLLDQDTQFALLDSGNAQWTLPGQVYDAVVATLIADPAFQQFFRHNASNNFFQQPASRGYEQALDSDPSNFGALVSGARLQRELPTISVTFADGLTLTLDGVGSYLLPSSPDYISWIPGIARGNSFSGGWPLLNQFVTVHDVDRSRVGFAVRTSDTSVAGSCSSGLPPSKAAATAPTSINAARSHCTWGVVVAGLLLAIATTSVGLWSNSGL